MLRFNKETCGNSKGGNRISIHPMLRFNFGVGNLANISDEISIHPMLRFNWAKEFAREIVKLFQYILCYGSTRSFMFLLNFTFISIHPMLRFNTSWCAKSSQWSWISIHPMLRFNLIHTLLFRLRNGFQYILCYGSTMTKWKKSMDNWYFNTSYVTVQRFLFYTIYKHIKISIHPMLRFNLKNSYLFQSSHWFQYILCYGSTHKFNSTILTTEISIHPMLRFNFFYK